MTPESKNTVNDIKWRFRGIEAVVQKVEKKARGSNANGGS